MNFISQQFFFFIVISLIVFHTLRQRVKKDYLFFPLNIAFLYFFLESPWALLPFLAFFLICYCFVKLLEYSPKRNILSPAIICIISLFLYLKQYSIIAFIPSVEYSYLIVGLSYILFRVIHLIIDIYGGSLSEKITFLSFTNYILFFLSYVSGPIQRYEDFKTQLGRAVREPLSNDIVYKSFSRLFSGYIKIGIVSVMMQSVFTYFSSFIEVGSITMLTVFSYSWAAFFYTMYLYYNFSGYMDIVIAIGQLFGFSLPENFNKPFESKNFMDFWSKWHITLSEWFKFYVFNPIVKALTSRWMVPKRVPYYGVFAYFVTFFIMGIWHGSTYSFLIFGIFLGFGVSINKLYDVEIRKRLAKNKYKALNKSAFYQNCTAGLTTGYFCIGLTCLWMGAEDTLWLFAFIGVPALIILGTVVSLSKFVFNKFLIRIKAVYNAFSGIHDTFLGNQSILALKAGVFFAYQFLTMHPVPEFIYKGF